MTELQTVEQALHSILLQKQSQLAQLDEADNALSELSGDDAYRIIGNIMVKTSSEKLKTELSEKKETAQQRVTMLEQQEEQLTQELEKLKNEALGGSK